MRIRVWSPGLRAILAVTPLVFDAAAAFFVSEHDR